MIGGFDPRDPVPQAKGGSALLALTVLLLAACFVTGALAVLTDFGNRLDPCIRDQETPNCTTSEPLGVAAIALGAAGSAVGGVYLVRRRR